MLRGLPLHRPQQRQVCWAHLLRDFARVATREGVAGAIGKRLQACGYALFRWREQGKPAGHFEWLQQRIRKQLQAGAAQTACVAHGQHLREPVKIELALWHFLRNWRCCRPTMRPNGRCGGFVIKRKPPAFTRSGEG